MPASGEKLDVVIQMEKLIENSWRKRVRAFDKNGARWQPGGDLLAILKPGVWVQIDTKKPHFGYVDNGEGERYQVGPGTPSKVKKEALEIIDSQGLYFPAPIREE